MVRYGLVWYSMVQYGMVWYGMVWYKMECYGIKGRVRHMYERYQRVVFSGSRRGLLHLGGHLLLLRGICWFRLMEKLTSPESLSFFWGEIIETACGLWTLRNWSKNISRERENRQSQSRRLFPTRFVWSSRLEHVFPMEVIFGTKSIIITAHENIHRAVILFFCLMAFYWVVWIY